MPAACCQPQSLRSAVVSAGAVVTCHKAECNAESAHSCLAQPGTVVTCHKAEFSIGTQQLCPGCATARQRAAVGLLIELPSNGMASDYLTRGML